MLSQGSVQKRWRPSERNWEEKAEHQVGSGNVPLDVRLSSWYRRFVPLIKQLCQVIWAPQGENRQKRSTWRGEAELSISDASLGEETETGAVGGRQSLPKATQSYWAKEVESKRRRRLQTGIQNKRFWTNLNSRDETSKVKQNFHTAQSTTIHWRSSTVSAVNGLWSSNAWRCEREWSWMERS